MNFADCFFLGPHHGTSVGQMPGKVKDFMSAAKKSGFNEVVCFMVCKPSAGPVSCMALKVRT